MLAQSTYYPPRGDWERRTPEEVGMDAGLLAAAIEFAQSQETTKPMDFSDQETIFGRVLGPDKPNLVDDARQRANRVGATRIPDQEDPVARTITAGQPAVSPLDLPVDAPPLDDIESLRPVLPLGAGLVE